ncbi:pilin [Hydromonas duriensis]|uniref:Type IV pilus assembly protein PilA n=1 Tax=Hydromonas duriensis TaxID=1527608 RepID=A0A4R6YBH8_9BURK|nr:prepilin-type N-terminal cleavage/methylation domain-containing protein [Hydromonas duriensis]TDR32995.1 type IV pilus assembly protein PilA [Hydromonas duriensis]
MNKHDMMRKIRTQFGFTLLELLVVIAVIGVLASLAVPRMQNQLNKAKFIDVINATGPYKTAVEMCFLKTNALTACDSGNANGYVPPALGANGNVQSVSVSPNGAITATGASLFDASGKDANGASISTPQTYVLTPTQNSNGLTWGVSGTCVASNLCDTK